MRTFHLTFAGLVAFAAVTGAAARDARAQDDFFRSSPGPLTKSHAEWDSQAQCNECHDGGKETNDRKCLGCHDHADLRARIDAGKGLHASAKVRGQKCEKCHLEHEGRNHDLRGWASMGPGGEKGFDHRLTGWPLKGKHAAIDCAECHKNKNKQGLRTYLGEDRFCGGCHQEDSPHEFERKEMMACDRCHGESVWKPPLRAMRFDHNDPKDAAMPLEGTHQDVTCTKCHPKAAFNLPAKDPDDCRNCHESPHTGHLFDIRDCDWCHSPKFRSLDKYSFAHGKRTKFDLTGAHEKIECYDCHTAKLAKKIPDRSCEGASCHGFPDTGQSPRGNPHRDRFNAFGGDPPKCETCHPSTTWEPKIFNHNKRTKFVLTAKHATTDCRSCHRGNKPYKWERFDPKTVGCMGCHKHTNAHNREHTDKECLGCHKEAGQIQLDLRRATAQYHGPKSNFPLEKAHAKVECVKCHINDVYENTPAECGVRCHEDSLHRGSLGDKCSNCHKGGQWEAVRFDHNDKTDSDWPLVGWHKKIPKCEDCHPERDYSNTPRTCAAEGCHAADDVHKGRLGDKCESCHLETGENIFDHNRQSRYKLDGSHLVVSCAECHPSIKFKPRPVDCFGCHPEPDVHKGRFGTLCETCHTTAAFNDILPLHDVGNFSLTGSHNNLDCRRCHKDSRPLQGSGNLCITCHRQDDIHSNSLSPRCGDCHTQWSFTPARFDHTTVGCNLTGLHRTLPCFDCHKNGNFGAVTGHCYGCHRDLALRVIPTPDGITRPNHAALIECGTCHNPNFWVPGNRAYGSLTICR